MRIKACVLISAMIFLLQFPSTGEVSISGETGFTSNLTEDREFNPTAGISFAMDSYRFFDQSWSGFWNGAGTVYRDFSEKRFNFGVEAGGDLSYMTGTSLYRLGLDIYYEGNQDEPDEYFMAEPVVFYSRDFTNLSLFTEHSFNLHYFAEDSRTYTGTAGFSIILFSSLLTEPSFTGGYSDGDEDSAFFTDPAIRLSWYPGGIWYIDGNMGFKSYFYDIPVYELHTDIALSYSVTTNIQTRLMLPLIFQYREKPDDDWLIFTPKLDLNWQLTEIFNLSFGLTDRWERDIQTRENFHELQGTMAFSCYF